MHFDKFKRIAAIFLAAAMMTSLSASVFAEGGRLLPEKGASSAEETETQSKSSSSGSISVSNLQKGAKGNASVSDDFLMEIKGKKSISKNQFKKYAVEFQLPTTYVQKFIKDEFVFKAGNAFTYIPVNSKLAKNKYNWNNLVHKKSGEIQYRSENLNGIKGIDVSTHQGNIDWKKVKADGVKFAIIRLGFRGYGTGKVLIDDKFHQNMKGATANGIKVGVYFYSQAISTAEAVEEAEMVLKNIKGYELDYPIVFDIEDAGAKNARTNGMSVKKATDITIAFCERIKKAGHHPMIYTNSRWFVSKLDMTRLTKYDKWLAQYYNTPFFPYQFQIWQYTGKGRVNGIRGDVDMNISFKNY